MATNTSPIQDSTPPSHHADPMIYKYPDLGGSVHAIFETQLPGAAIDSPSQSQISVMSPETAALRRAEKAPAKEPLPPPFGLFEEATSSSSQDRTQLPFFPATIGSARVSPAPLPATVEQTMMVAICKTTGLMEVFNHKLDDLTSQNTKTNARINLLSHAMEEVIESLNKNLVAFEKLQKTLSKPGLSPPQAKPAMPLPRKPVPKVVILRKPNTTPADADNTPPAPPVTHRDPTTTAVKTRTIPHRKAHEGPKIYEDKPLTPEPITVPTPHAGPSNPPPETFLRPSRNW